MTNRRDDPYGNQDGPPRPPFSPSGPPPFGLPSRPQGGFAEQDPYRTISSQPPGQDGGQGPYRPLTGPPSRPRPLNEQGDYRPVSGTPSRPRPFNDQGDYPPAPGTPSRPRPFNDQGDFRPTSGTPSRPSFYDDQRPSRLLTETPSRPRPGTHNLPPPPSRTSPQRTLILVGLVVLLVAILGGTGYLLTRKSGTSSVSKVASSTDSTGGSTTGPPVIPGGTPGAQTPISENNAPAYPTQGWTVGGPNYALAFAFAQGNRRFGYACGVATGQTTVSIAATQDTWATWKTTQTPATLPANGLCRLSINPTNINDVALLTGAVDAKTNVATADLWRSTDGGQNWKQLALPADSPVGPNGFDLRTAWAGDTLAVPTNKAAAGGPKTLALSLNGGALTWANEQYPITSLVGVGGILYVSTGCAKAGCVGAYHSDDNGATWKPLVNARCAYGVKVVAGGGDNHTIFAICAQGTTPLTKTAPVASGDIGNTWTQLPALPDQASWDEHGLLSTPDGTVYLISSEYATPGIPAPLLKLARGANAWVTDLTTFPATPDGNWGASWDNTGHVQALWVGRAVATGSTLPLPGMQYAVPK